VAVADELLNIVSKVNSAIRSDRGKRIALITVLARHKTRIYEQGLAANGSQIGTYSKKYGALKRALGKNPGFVNLQLTGQMQNDYGLVVNGDQYAFGFQNQFNADKMGYVQDHFNKDIAHLSDSELDLLLDVLSSELEKGI
jgi:hypothetical protein